jgi:hypothetical protein
LGGAQQRFVLVRFLAYAGLVLLHAAASVAAFLWHYTVSSSQFDRHAVSPLALVLSSTTEKVLWFPLAKPLLEAVRLPGLWGWLPVLLNSALWVLVLAFLMRWRRPSGPV